MSREQLFADILKGIYLEAPETIYKELKGLPTDEIESVYYAVRGKNANPEELQEWLDNLKPTESQIQISVMLEELLELIDERIDERIDDRVSTILEEMKKLNEVTNGHKIPVPESKSRAKLAEDSDD